MVYEEVIKKVLRRAGCACTVRCRGHRRCRVYQLFLSDEERVWMPHTIVHALGVPKRAVERSLSELYRAGLLMKTRKGHYMLAGV